MMRQSSSRNQRCKKLKMKHVLQLIVLLAITIWLLYQLKHTFDKKHAVDTIPNNPNENPITENDQIVPDKTTKLGRKDLPQYTESRNSNGDRDNEVDEEEEEKDTELEQLLEDVDVRENGQEEEDRTAEENGDEEAADGEYGSNGEEDEEVNMDGDANGDANETEEKITLPSVNASISVEADNASNQTVSVDMSIHPENNSTASVEVKEVEKSGVQDEFPAIQGSSVQATNESTTDAQPHLSTTVEDNRGEIKDA